MYSLFSPMHFTKNNISEYAPQSVRGFGLIELMVSISIVAMVSAIILTRNNSFNGAVLLRNQAYEIAFAVRQAQLLAVSGNTGAVSASRQYGVFFDTSTAQQTSYVIFQDTNNNGYYNAGTDTIIGGTRGRLDSRFEIRGITNLAGSSQTGGGSNTGFSVTFIRPNFDAIFENQVGTVLNGPIYVDVSLLNDTGIGTGDVRRVEVTGTGQIKVTTY